MKTTVADFFDFCSEYQPNERHHQSMLPEGRKVTSEYTIKGITPLESAVGIHIYPNEKGNPCFLLIQRSEYEGKHSGQYALPGGKREITDESLSACALRESIEELGAGLEDGKYILGLSPVFIPVSNFMMYPFIFAHNTKPTWEINEREIQRVIPIDLSIFSTNTPIICKEMPRKDKARFSGNVPGFQWEEHWIWGATALVLSELKALYLSFDDALKPNRTSKGPVQ